MLNDIRKRLPGLISELRARIPQEGVGLIADYVALAGPFLSGQILLDATYAGNIVPYSGNDFLVVGPGAHWGLNIIFGQKLTPPAAAEKCRLLFKMQKEAFEFLKKEQGLDWETVRWQNPEYPNAPYLCLHDIQNSLCEFRKYWRLKSGEKAKKRYFKPQN